jgi:hypothetical protein
MHAGIYISVLLNANIQHHEMLCCVQKSGLEVKDQGHSEMKNKTYPGA